jgi:hypothetical protein
MNTEITQFQVDLERVSKSKGIPVQAWTGPEFFRKLMLPGFKITGIQMLKYWQIYTPPAFTL